MTIENHLTNFELSKRLKELKVPQKSFYCWQPVEDSTPKIWPRVFDLDEFRKGLEDERPAAFLASELGNILQWEKLHIFGTPDELLQYIDGKTNEVNARAKMLIYLIENKIIDIGK